MASKEVIEKVARELCLSEGMNPDEDVIAGQAAGFENFGPRYQSAERSQNTCGNRNYMEDARVAASTIIAALQEPTEAMLEAGLAWDEHVAVDETHPRTRGTWRAMLAASAIGEKAE